MSSAIAAAATGAIIGGAMAGRSASKSAKSAARSEAAQLQFEQEKYQDWKDTYGDVEDNLSDYYGGLSADYYEAQGLEAFQQEHQAALTGVREALAQRGISDSGIAGITELDFAHRGAETRANIRTSAPGLAAEEQRQFLQVGLGQNPGAGVSQTLAQRTASSKAEASRAQQVAGQAISSGVSAVGTALSDYIQTKNATPTPTTPPAGGTT